jgi:voltage-gated potassium channel
MTLEQFKIKVSDIFINPLVRVLGILLVVWFVAGVGILLLEANNQENFSSIKDTLWWAIVTITTVGYGGQEPIGDASRLFAVFVMMSGITLTALFTGTISSIFVTRKIREGRGLESIKTKNHIVICGWNQNIDMVIDSLQKFIDKNGNKIVLVNDLSEDQISSLITKFSDASIQFVRGDHTREVILKKANVSEAKAVIIISDDISGSEDEKTILSVLTIKNIASNIKVIAHVNNRKNITHLKRAKADEIITNDNFESFMAVSHISDPGVPQVVNSLIDVHSPHRFKSVSIPDQMVGKTFDELFQYYNTEKGWMCIGLFDEKVKIGIADFLSSDTSNLDAFIERKLREAGHPMSQESQVSIIVNPDKNHVIKEGEGAIIIP